MGGFFLSWYLGHKTKRRLKMKWLGRIVNRQSSCLHNSGITWMRKAGYFHAGHLRVQFNLSLSAPRESGQNCIFPFVRTCHCIHLCSLCRRANFLYRKSCILVPQSRHSARISGIVFNRLRGNTPWVVHRMCMAREGRILMGNEIRRART